MSDHAGACCWHDAKDIRHFGRVVCCWCGDEQDGVGEPPAEHGPFDPEGGDTT